MHNKRNVFEQHQLFISRFQPRLRDVIIPEAEHFITMDADGGLFGWAQRPRISDVVPRWVPGSPDRLHACSGAIEVAGLNWQDCCFPLPHAWKTGSLWARFTRAGLHAPDAWIQLSNPQHHFVDWSLPAARPACLPGSLFWLHFCQPLR